jgi:hypothetical protein
MKKPLLNFVGAILFFLAFSTTTLHAQCTILNTPAVYNTTSNGGTFDYVQSFTAPCSGNMSYFQLTASEAGTLPGAMLYVYDGNVSNGTPIYSQAYPSISVAGNGSPITINITGTLPLVSGNQYSFRFEATTLNFRFTTGDQYVGGHAWQNGGALTTTDFYFEIAITGCASTGLTADVAQLPDVNNTCSVSSITPPTATTSCAVVIDGVPDVTFPITDQGTTVVTWTYDDGNGNSITQLQNVIIEDVTDPIPDLAQLPDLTNQCTVMALTPPTATDNCAGVIIGTTTSTAPIQTLGTSIITWTFDDGNGNITTQTQNVINPTIDNTVTVTGSMIMANQTVASYQWVDCDNAFAPILGEISQSFTATVTGNYAVEIEVNGCVDTSACELIDFSGIEELTQNEKKLVKIVDLMGRETKFVSNTPLIFMYSDGTIERVMEIEH